MTAHLALAAAVAVLYSLGLLAVGTTFGVRFARASARIDALIAVHHREVDINDAADLATDSAL